MTHGRGSPVRSIKRVRRIKKLQGGKPNVRRRRLRGPIASSISRAPKRPTRSIKRVRRVKKLQGGKRVKPVASSTSRGPKQLGPPKVGFRTVKGRGGKRILIKRPRPRIVGPTESQAIGKSPRRRTGRRTA